MKLISLLTLKKGLEFSNSYIHFETRKTPGKNKSVRCKETENICFLKPNMKNTRGKYIMKKVTNTVMLMLAALLLLAFNAQAQTATPAPTPERIDLSKEGELKSIPFTLKIYETTKFVVKLPKDKYLWVYFLDPSLDNATNPLKQVDSSLVSIAGGNGTTESSKNGIASGFVWELTDTTDKKIFTSSGFIKIDAPQIPADGEYYLTINCNKTVECKNWLRIKVDKEAAAQSVTVDFP